MPSVLCTNGNTGFHWSPRSSPWSASTVHTSQQCSTHSWHPISSVVVHSIACHSGFTGSFTAWVRAYSAAAAAHAGLATPCLSSESAISFTVSPAGVYFKPSSFTTLELLMYVVSPSAPSGKAAAAAGKAAFSVSVTKRADIDCGWLTMYLRHGRVPGSRQTGGLSNGAQ